VHCKLRVIGLFLAWLVLGAESSVAWGDGGALRCSERRDGRLITVFTTPTPLRAGPVDISALVQDAESGRPLRDVRITVRAHPIHQAQGRVSAPATTDAATNKLLRAARLQLSVPGRWHVELVVAGSSQEQPIGFDLEVGEALPPWLQMSPWIGWPLVVIGFFAIHQLRVQRRKPSRPRLSEPILPS
jgi:hypothetical protein